MQNAPHLPRALSPGNLSPGHLGPTQALLSQLPVPGRHPKRQGLMLPASAEGARCAGSGPKACPPPETCSGSSPVPVLLRGLRVEKGLISRQNGKPWFQQHHVGGGETGGGAVAAARPPPRAPRGLTRVEVGAEGKAGVEEGRRHGQGQQRVGHPRAGAALTLRTPAAWAGVPASSSSGLRRCGAHGPPLLAPPATAAARAPVGAATD